MSDQMIAWGGCAAVLATAGLLLAQRAWRKQSQVLHKERDRRAAERARYVRNARGEEEAPPRRVRAQGFGRR